MRKHDSFRAALVEAFPKLTRDPDKLAIYVDQGSVAARLEDGEPTSGFEWRYTLTAILLDFADDTNLLAATVIAWLKRWQPERLANFAAGNEAIGFRVDVLDNSKADVEITLELTEAVDILPDGTAEYRAEPDLDTGFDGVPDATALDAITLGGEALLP